MGRARDGIVVLLCAVAASIAASADADVLPADYEPPVCAPVTCPEGSTVTGGGHGSCPADCAPVYTECAADGSCAAGARCVPTRFCILMRPTGRVVQNVVVGECSADGSCAEGTCAEVSRCVTVPAGTGGPSLPGPRAGGGTASTAERAAAPAPAPSAPAAGGGMCATATRARRTPGAGSATVLLVFSAFVLGRARARQRCASRGR